MIGPATMREGLILVLGKRNIYIFMIWNQNLFQVQSVNLGITEIRGLQVWKAQEQNRIKRRTSFFLLTWQTQLLGLKHHMFICNFQQLTKFYRPTVNPFKTPSVVSKTISVNLTCLFLSIYEEVAVRRNKVLTFYKM